MIPPQIKTMKNTNTGYLLLFSEQICSFQWYFEKVHGKNLSLLNHELVSNKTIYY